MKEPVFFDIDSLYFTEAGLNRLKEEGVKELYGFSDGGFIDRVSGLSTLLKRSLDSSNHGKNLSIDDNLASELKRLLGAVCYLFNSSSFKNGKYYVFDKEEISRKIGRTIR